MIGIDSRFADPVLEADFRDDVRARQFWVLVGPWLASSTIVLFSIVQAYLRLGPGMDLVIIAGCRVLLLFSILAFFCAARRGLNWRGYYAAAVAVLIGLVAFNMSAVLTGSSAWDRIARAAIIELFLIALTLMTQPKEAYTGLVTVWFCHVALGLAGYAANGVEFFNDLLVVTLAALICTVLVWRFSLSERQAFLDRRELQRARIEAERSSQAKSRFLANMSHEIRTPMTGILGMLDLALDQEMAPSHREPITQARESASSLLSILNDVLDFSKIESEGITLEDRAFETGTLFRQVEALFRNRAEVKGIGLELVTEGVPAVLDADSGRLRQVLLNLVGNAIKFTASGSVRLFASWQQQGSSDGRLRVAIADDGIGISKQEQARLFRRFNQADTSTTRRFGGTGLGLSISKEIVEAMNGRIGVTSCEGAGSTFWFEVDCRIASAIDIPEAPVSVQTDSLKPLKLLVAEDNPINQRIVAAFLRKAGHEAVIVGDGQAAVERVQHEDFDVVLMDVQMPRLDGVGALHAIRELAGAPARLPILALTANTMDGDREELLAAGMDGYIVKPIDRKVLLETIARAADKRVVEA